MIFSGRLIIGLAALTLLAACVRGPATGEAKRVLPAKGTVHPDYQAGGNPLAGCALYIPGASDTSGGRGYPLVIAFDPHADGKLPVEMYRELADKYHFILAGSNRSKNGLSPEQVDSIVSVLYRELRQNLPVDTNRIYLLGFSGGGRIAMMNGFYRIPVRGVVSCGAGLAGAGGAPVFRPEYAAIAGMADFNMNEIAGISYPLEQAGISHLIQTFDGEHAWPPAGTVETVFRWFSANAMRDGTIPKDPALVSRLTGEQTGAARSSAKSGDMLKAFEQAVTAMEFSRGLTDTVEIALLMQEIRSAPKYIEQEKFRTGILAEEETERRNLNDAIASKEVQWWQMKYRRWMEAETKESKPGKAGDILSDTEWKRRERSYMDRRLIAFTRLLAYMNATSVMTSRNEEAALRIITIYQVVDPGNPEAWYLQAVLRARKGNDKEALLAIATAVEKGFSDKVRMTGEADFAILRELPEYFNLLQKIK